VVLDFTRGGAFAALPGRPLQSTGPAEGPREAGIILLTGYRGTFLRPALDWSFRKATRVASILCFTMRHRNRARVPHSAGLPDAMAHPVHPVRGAGEASLFIEGNRHVTVARRATS
jgi:hypothetical protein